MWTPWTTAALAALAVFLMARKRDGAEAASLSGGSAVGGRPVDAEPSAEIRDAIIFGCAPYAIPAAFGLANAAHESRFRPRVGLDTLAGGAPAHAIPERSIGLMGINVNPNTPTGRARIATIKQQRGVTTDAEVLEALRDPAYNVAFWAAQIVWALAQRADRRGLTGRAKWIAVRVWLAAGTLEPDRNEGLRRANLFAPTFDKWLARFPLEVT